MSAQPMRFPHSPALRVRPVPDRAAPYLTEADLTAIIEESYPATRPSGRTLQLVPPPRESARPDAHPASRAGVRARPAGPGVWAIGGVEDIAAPPSPRAWAAQMSVALLEVAAGSRPAAQVARWTTPEVFRSLVRHCAAEGRPSAPRSPRPAGAAETAHRAPRRGRATQAAWRVRTVIADSPAAGVVEATVVVSDGTRARAVALRLVDRDGRWVAEAFATA